MTDAPQEGSAFAREHRVRWTRRRNLVRWWWADHVKTAWRCLRYGDTSDCE